MGLIGCVLGGMSAVMAGVVTKVLADDAREWSVVVSNRVTRSALSRVPSALQERLCEEWASHLKETPGTTGKFVASLGMLWAAHQLARQRYCETEAEWLNRANNNFQVWVSELTNMMASPLCPKVRVERLNRILTAAEGIAKSKPNHGANVSDEFVQFARQLEKLLPEMRTVLHTAEASLATGDPDRSDDLPLFRRLTVRISAMGRW